METLAGNVPLLTLVGCPRCREDLEVYEHDLRCSGCGLFFPVVDGIPMLLDGGIDDDEPPSDLVHKAGQARYYDRDESADFEIRRPHGTPPLYEWLISEKLERSLEGIQPMVPGWTALTVCGGSGMDAEFLARAGCRVISSDISLGAAKRARERARRYGFQLLPIVADVESLPFRDQSLDLVYVHDGLHHLTSPLTGLNEMARVARRAVSITEPARALATVVAIRLGIADEVEDAGNAVARLTPGDVSAALREVGFGVLKSQRYAMYYPHEPGRGFHRLSRPPLFGFVKTAWRVLNATIGPHIGNKLSIVAIPEGTLEMPQSDSWAAGAKLLAHP